jgi:hypothetical protein
VRRGDDDDHVAQLGRIQGPYRPARAHGQRGEGYDRHAHPRRGQLRCRPRAARPQHRRRQDDIAAGRELIDRPAEPAAGTVVNERFRGQLGQRHRVHAREPVLRGRHHHDLLTAERLRVLVGPGRPRPDDEVRPAGLEDIQHAIRAGVLLQVELDVGELPPPAAQHRQEHPRGHRLRAGNAEPAGRPGRHRPARHHRPVGGCQGNPGLGDCRQTSRRRPDAPRQPLDGRRPEFPLDGGDLVRQRGLRHMKRRRSPRQRALIDDGDQALQSPHRNHAHMLTCPAAGQPA